MSNTPVGFPVDKHNPLKGRLSLLGTWTDQDVPIADLVATQRTVREAEVRRFIAGAQAPADARGKFGQDTSLPTVVRKGGRLLIWDGHHRLEAARRRGDETARVHLIDLDGALARWARS